MSIKKIAISEKEYPVLALRGLTVFPYMTLPFDIGRSKSITAIETAMAKDQMIALVSQKDARVDDPEEDDIYKIGTLCRIRQILKLPDNNVRVLVEGINRIEITEYVQFEPYIIGHAVQYEIEKSEDAIRSREYNEALLRQLQNAFEDYAAMSQKIPDEAVKALSSISNIDHITDTIAAHLSIRAKAKQELLEEFDEEARLIKLLEVLANEVEISGYEQEISRKVKDQIEKAQKEYYLREQLKVIQEELGDKDGIGHEVEEYKNKLGEINLPDEETEKLTREIDKLAKMAPGSAEGTVIRNYLDWIFGLPWNTSTNVSTDINAAEAVLNEDHFGLQDVKERILEFLAIKAIKKSLKGSIICLVGPPGVGKTSIAKSIARAVNRNYVRMSLGGVRDEAEIRGHRRTYVGAIPGRIITALKQAKSNNPLILMDEIDKMSSDFRGDPASALLEVLDSQQNFEFRDHYIEIPFDLSDVMFITTANSLEGIPNALLDRMEVIKLSSYTSQEKLEIAMRHLVPKQITEHGLTKSQIVFKANAISDIIEFYTREAGVRTLERTIATICRKTAKRIIAGECKKLTITPKIVTEMLGAKKFTFDVAKNKNEIGVARGLAWTSVGGDTLSIEVSVMPGTGKLELTGQLGDVMKESALAAMSFIRANAAKYKISNDFYKNYDIHIHVPEGATPKDGPSAGITLATALLSALTNTPVKWNVAMTGEITLRGRVLPIGGLKEKSIAAYRAGIDTVIIPEGNKKDLEEIPEIVKEKINFIPVQNVNQVFNAVM